MLNIDPAVAISIRRKEKQKPHHQSPLSSSPAPKRIASKSRRSNSAVGFGIVIAMYILDMPFCIVFAGEGFSALRALIRFDPCMCFLMSLKIFGRRPFQSTVGPLALMSLIVLFPQTTTIYTHFMIRNWETAVQSDSMDREFLSFDLLPSRNRSKLP